MKPLACIEEAEGAEAAVWRGGRTHWSLFGVSYLSSSTFSSSPPYALGRVTHRKYEQERWRWSEQGGETPWRHIFSVYQLVGQFVIRGFVLFELDLKTSSPARDTELYLFCPVGVHGLTRL